ncbi:sterol desaturase family protein [Novosphingobium mangrovi (ex Huang et al. 2023)]|uniref:Sterol desaturase family protein n=1 Tax=Novosphingobium mangrovi (ex Huang et al. 2023) TaxID=2976432 RepID=A0ABT2I9D4_9SPHN|nr:sterol desaturase family protein [Novosphingobium mangrovi (ex Huang et al. 2023)]MCT2401391.1 sterol desaturase family protein [Novosphingobium mangrovi (ex Huang et al. 2023)]
MRLALQHPWILFVMLTLVAAEMTWRRRSALGYDGRAAAASLGVALGQTVFRPLTGILLGMILFALADVAPLHFPAEDWRTWVAGFFAVEFAYYWFHRCSHTVRWMWATHAVHHSSPEFVLPSAIRLGWTEFFSLGWVFFAALVLVGFPPLVVVTLLGVNLIYQFPLHTEAVGRLGPLEWLFNTPSHHRAHHGSEPEFLDCNFGGVLIVWDRMFGTFRAEPVNRRLRYGLVHELRSRNPVRIALHEWGRMLGDMRRAKGAGAKLKVALGRP